ncbi:MAG: aldehyde dehydrogenase family protein [Proteobacteria bacterium]|nr:aldehyde dehydrogenase family protein [Pseudomonadota bacterium]
MKTEYRSLNPETLMVHARFKVPDLKALSQHLEHLEKAQRTWQERSLVERKAALLNVATEIELSLGQLVDLMILEIAKPRKEAEAEVRKCIQSIRDFCELEMDSVLESREALGVVLAVMPWNFPLWQVVRSAVPLLIAGNAYLLKHSELVPQTSLLIEELFKKHLSVFRQEFLSHEQVSELIKSSQIAGLTFTGSTQVGRILAQKAAFEMKPSVFELGGSDPYVVMEDADLGLAVRNLVKARSQNNGQSCLAAKRWIVHESFRKDWISRVAAEWEQYQVGEAQEKTTDLSVLAHPRFREKADRQVDAFLRSGQGSLLYRQSVPEHPSRVPPQVIQVCEVKNLYRDEEIFAPVALLSWFQTEQEALSLANGTVYGLGAAVFSQDRERALALARGIQAGAVFINDFVKSDLRVALGGRKYSGRGYEMGLQGLIEFTALKWVK